MLIEKEISRRMRSRGLPFVDFPKNSVEWDDLSKSAHENPTSSNGSRIECYTSITEVPVSIWEKFAQRDSVGLEMGYLYAIEDSGINDIHPYYLIGYRNAEPIGIAYCFSIQMDLAKMANSYPPEVLRTIKTWKPDFMEVRIVEVGHIASIGTTIEALQPYMPNFLDMLSEKLDEIAQFENADLGLIRDISPSSLSEFDVLKNKGYQSVMGFPVARMKLNWSSFDEYLAALKSQKRHKIRQRRFELQAPEIKVEIIENYAPYAERLAELWKNVAKRNNGYEHERLTPSFFEALSHHLRGRSHVVAIKLHGKIVAYGLNLIGDEEYFGMAEGLDYAVRDRYDLYANNIFEGLRVACELKKKYYNIGITTYDFKTSIGAELNPTIYLMKAFKESAYTPVYADLIQESIEQPENHHRAFRGIHKSNRPQLKNIQSTLTHSTNSLDPFTKHLNYIRVDTARSTGLYAFCPEFESSQEPIIQHTGRDVIMLGTNSYLGLSTHPKVTDAMHAAIDKYGSGCSGSPLLNGTLDLHNQLTNELAQFMEKQDALIFSTGYQTNVGVVSALVSRNDVLIMDKRNHASLIDGARLSGATLARYKHNDLEALEAVLKKYVHKPKLIVTDSVFSMEGTLIDLPKIVLLAKKYQARLMLDESHAVGVFGKTGRGVAEHYSLLNEVDIIMGTFSKSFASVGGFVAGDRKIIDTLKHIARSHIFSASLPPAAVAAVLTALKIIDEEPERRTQLLENARFLANGLQDLGFRVGRHGGPIIPVFCGHEILALAAFSKLFDEGVFVNPVTYPAVPKDQEILRISLMATHDETMLLHALDVFKRIRTPNWPALT